MSPESKVEKLAEERSVLTGSETKLLVALERIIQTAHDAHQAMCDEASGGEPDVALYVERTNIGKTLMGTIRHIRSENEALREALVKAEQALGRIATEHVTYGGGPFETQAERSYSTGVTDGHRCAANVARAALKQIQELSK